MQEETYWLALEGRDPQFNGVFVYAVRTTGVYCRPTCTSRRPRRENVAFFAAPDAAERAGYRACRRCDPRAAALDPHVALVAQICRFLEEPREGVPTLEELAARFALSPAHLQRTFKRIAGVSPRQYADAHRAERLRTGLRVGADVTGALYEAGYGSSSGFYDQAPASLGMTPAAYRSGGRAAQIGYAVAPCALGHLLVAATERGICKVSLGDSPAALEADLRDEFPAAELRADSTALEPWLRAVLEHLDGQRPHLDLPLDIQASAFQRIVWEALRAIPYGATRSYQQVAQAIGRPTAARAVARAVATNPVALLIPCHRVVRADGEPGGYRWGADRKRKLLEGER
ncbi:MAG TPA: bifunctional DNA-binding transcriptional regulator/O6-methylguanine-DNA methyltransferase Ada [Roseiflexaceae bacterium]|nr:bifunctional DNA-binding transcriptional regulator/O6-methylguanine-DNA methyltransferase Ada [Roseiflexaceae bacterium]